MSVEFGRTDWERGILKNLQRQIAQDTAVRFEKDLPIEVWAETLLALTYWLAHTRPGRGGRLRPVLVALRDGINAVLDREEGGDAKR